MTATTTLLKGPQFARNEKGDICMPKPINLPFLPGHFLNDQKDSHHKTTRWSILGGQRIELAEGVTHDYQRFVKTPRATSYQLPTRDDFPISSQQRAFYKEESEMQVQPAWMAQDRCVLRFHAHSKSDIYSSEESCIPRDFLITYYLEDDTLHIVEPQTENSGLLIFAQGSRSERPTTFVRRHRIPHVNGGYFSPELLKVGDTIQVYGRSFYLYACDVFTRRFYENKGEPQIPDIKLPDSMNPMHRKVKRTDFKSKKTPEKHYTETLNGGGSFNKNMKQYMDNYGKVIRFFAFSDDLMTPMVERRFFTILYHLSDDTVKIISRVEANSGRDKSDVLLLKRQWLPRSKTTNYPGPTLARGPEDDVFSPEKYITALDLRVGKTINLVARDFAIYDADEWTRNYYKRTFDIELAPAIDTSWILPDKTWHANLLDKDEEPPEPPNTSLQLMGGRGVSHVDLDRKMFEGDYFNYTLRFRARLAREDVAPEDEDRFFLIIYHIADSSITIREDSGPNSGRDYKAKFAERARRKNVDTNEIIMPEDLMEGKICQIEEKKFEILEMDERTRKYFRNGCKPDIGKAAMEEIFAKVQDAVRKKSTSYLQEFIDLDEDRDGVLGFDEFRRLVRRIGFTLLTDEEICEIMSHFDLNCEGHISFKTYCEAKSAQEFDAIWGSETKHQRPCDLQEYGKLALLKQDDLKETHAIRKVIKELSSIIHEKPRIQNLLISEFKRRSMEDGTFRAKIVTAKQIQECLLRYGFTFDLKDIQLAINFLNPSGGDMDYISFLSLLKSVYHDIYGSRF